MTDFPCCGNRVTVWRVISRDPDENEAYDGELTHDDGANWWVQIDGDTHESTFRKKTRAGVTLWRIQKLPKTQH